MIGLTDITEMTDMEKSNLVTIKIYAAIFENKHKMKK